MRIGILSDTHLPASVASLDGLGPEPAEFLASMDLIIHAGDVVLPSVLDWCGQFAEVVCAQGNHDHFEDERMSEIVVVEPEGWRIGVVHDVEGVPPSVKHSRGLEADRVQGRRPRHPHCG
jgi:putative phosphoesterase